MPALVALTPRVESLYRAISNVINAGCDRGMGDDEVMEAVAAAMANFAAQLPSHLSGGFQQRVDQLRRQFLQDQRTPVDIVGGHA